MILATIHQLRVVIKQYPEIVEAPGNTSFRMATFKIAGKGCIAIKKDGEHATFALLKDDINALILKSSAKIEPILKTGNLIGIRVDLTELKTEKIKALVKMACSKSCNS